MVDVARFFLEFVQEESCGKCVPCRVGTKRLLEILDRICNGEGQEGDIEKLIELGNEIKETALCGLGKTAANPVLSTIRHFRHEYVAHIRDKEMPGRRVPGLVGRALPERVPAVWTVPGFVSLVAETRFAEALACTANVIRSRRPAPAFVSILRDRCRRAGSTRGWPFAGVKRFMVDQEVTIRCRSAREQAERGPQSRRRWRRPCRPVCAFFSRVWATSRWYLSPSRGRRMMVQTIPSYRLPREDFLPARCAMIENLGVDIQPRRKLGRDFTLKGLREEGYEAVFLAVRAPRCMTTRYPQRNIEGVTEAISSCASTISAARFGRERVVVVGGGNPRLTPRAPALRWGGVGDDHLPAHARRDAGLCEEIEEGARGRPTRAAVTRRRISVMRGRPGRGHPL
jgi:NADH-quinone oxidoreductase subunit F